MLSTMSAEPKSVLSGPWPGYFMVFTALHGSIWCIARLRGASSPVLHPPNANQAAHMASHCVVQLLGFLVLTCYGCSLWDFGLASTRSGPIRPFDSDEYQLAQMMTGFQLYEFILSVLVPRLRGKYNELLGHHACTCMLAGLAAKSHFLLFYAPFFMGVSELSSLPLAVMDTFKNFPQLAPRYPALNERSRELFAASFLLLRNVYWPYVNLYFWYDCVVHGTWTFTQATAHLKKGAHTEPPPPHPHPLHPPLPPHSTPLLDPQPSLVSLREQLSSVHILRPWVERGARPSGWSWSSLSATLG